MLFRRLDIADPASVDDFAAWAREMGGISILINNAGLALSGSLYLSISLGQLVAEKHHKVLSWCLALHARPLTPLRWMFCQCMLRCIVMACARAPPFGS